MRTGDRRGTAGALDVVVAVVVGVAVSGYVAFGVRLARVRRRVKAHALEPLVGRRVTVFTGTRLLIPYAGQLVAVDPGQDRLELATSDGPRVVLLSDVRVVEDALGQVRYTD